MSLDKEIVKEIDDGTIFLRKIEREDAKFLFRALNNKETIKYMSIGPLLSLRHTKNLIERYLNHWENQQQFNYIIDTKFDGIKESIGAVSIWNISWIHKRAEIGIWIKPTYWEKGFGKKTIDLAKIVGFDYLNLHRLDAHITTLNHRSIKLFKSCGFEEECVLQHYLYLRGKYHNAMILACVNSSDF